MGLWEALSKGEGTPWGAAQTGRPNFPSMNPEDYEGFDTSKLAAGARARIGNQAAKAREQALARLQASGVHGADTGAAVANVAGQQTDALADMEGKMALMGYQSQGANRDAALRKYENDLMANAGENQGRGNFWNSLMQAAAFGLMA